MGFMDKLFKTQQNNAKEVPTGIPWEPLESEDQLDNVINNSTLKPKVIFKHSTRCGISRMVLKQFENGFEKNDDEVTFYFLDLLNYREVSAAVASKLNVVHQSPQVIILYNKEILHTESHQGIDIKKVQQIVTNKK
ncbi:bacillithiol system redox-active protein YtxJ [Nonlabens sp. Ci31]|jgi:bacillithiol system protein YtxJ|uniref:bacillithiol system redox-active protein YtxJ n=1 Tax=Nonlabens sp. Ci31 TaxID=2608253 RepID=UPI001463AEB4|nr:bacillithiol system redox-active protein YtxJ [Nonlabens sp. Ci31]QJP35083.1 bacillithiol system redox-active protein YtxJ [Nonlabens sp. Ci31]